MFFRLVDSLSEYTRGLQCFRERESTSDGGGAESETLKQTPRPVRGAGCWAPSHNAEIMT